MAMKIDLSKLKKEDIPIISLTGTTYLIDGNFKSEYAIKLSKTVDMIEEARKKNDTETVYNILKGWVYELLTMNKSGSYIDEETGKKVNVTKKDITNETIDKEFNDYQVIELLLTQILALANS